MVAAVPPQPLKLDAVLEDGTKVTWTAGRKVSSTLAEYVENDAVAITFEIALPNIAVVAMPLELVLVLLVVSEYGGVAEDLFDWNVTVKFTAAPCRGEPRSLTLEYRL